MDLEHQKPVTDAFNLSKVVSDQYSKLKDEEDLLLVLKNDDLEKLLISVYYLNEHRVSSFSFSGGQLNIKLKKG